MKILHVTQNYFPSIGGTQYLMQNLSEHLNKEYNDEVEVFTTNSLFGPNSNKFEKIGLAEEIINGVRVKRFPFLRSHKSAVRLISKTFRQSKSVRSACTNFSFGPVSYSLFQAMNRSHAEVMAASSLHFLFADYPRWRKYLSNPKPFVLHGAPHLEVSPITDTYKKRINAADLYIANTDFEKDHLVQSGVEEEKIRVVGIGTSIIENADFSLSDACLRKAHGIPDEHITITYLGRQEAFKGLPLLLQAFKRLSEKNDNLTLIIAGARGGYSNAIDKIKANEKNIHVYNNITEKQKTEILRCTDILVLPSKEESFGIVFIEAWSFYKPVIGANIPAIASLINDGKDGLLFRKDDVESLISKMDVLIYNKNFREELGVNGNKKFRENYRWEIVAAKFRSAYIEAIKNFSCRSLINTTKSTYEI